MNDRTACFMLGLGDRHGIVPNGGSLAHRARPGRLRCTQPPSPSSSRYRKLISVWRKEIPISSSVLLVIPLACRPVLPLAESLGPAAALLARGDAGGQQLQGEMCQLWPLTGSWVPGRPAVRQATPTAPLLGSLGAVGPCGGSSPGLDPGHWATSLCALIPAELGEGGLQGAGGAWRRRSLEPLGGHPEDLSPSRPSARHSGRCRPSAQEGEPASAETRGAGRRAPPSRGPTPPVRPSQLPEDLPMFWRILSRTESFSYWSLAECFFSVGNQHSHQAWTSHQGAPRPPTQEAIERGKTRRVRTRGPAQPPPSGAASTEPGPAARQHCAQGPGQRLLLSSHPSGLRPGLPVSRGQQQPVHRLPSGDPLPSGWVLAAPAGRPSLPFLHS